MTGLLEFREKLKMIYSKNDVFIMPVVKFLIALMVMNTVNGQLGYMTRLDNAALVLIVALACSFLPLGSIALFAMLFALLHMYALSLEVAAVGLVVFLLIFLLYLRFCPKESVVIVITMVLCLWELPYVMPVIMGLVSTPVSALSVGCGVIMYYLFVVVNNNAANIGTMGETEAIAKLRLIIDGLLDNKEMLVMIVAFAITVAVVYFIRRMSMDYSWTIAIVAGVMLDFVIILIGDLMYDTNVSVLNAVLGALVAVIVAKVIEFFRFCVDYGRTERVQFEDDEYYYYVKAVPKMSVATATNTVKKINTQHRPASGNGRSGASQRTAHPGQRNVRTVTTERMQGGTGSNRYSRYGNEERLSGGRSVTISSQDVNGEVTDDYEELF